jgi:carbonic anhydrase
MKIETLFSNNRKWARGMRKNDPKFFLRLSRLQKPQFLWIGCSDSRVPANEIIGLLPGELFVHRNVANLVYTGDLNCHSVLRYAIDVLKVKYIIVCGHYGCGGVSMVAGSKKTGENEVWLKSIRDTMNRHRQELGRIKSREDRVNRLCELNVLQQALNVTQSEPVQRAWRNKRPLSVHAWIYDLRDGLIRELRRYEDNRDRRTSGC